MYQQLLGISTVWTCTKEFLSTLVWIYVQWQINPLLLKGFVFRIPQIIQVLVWVVSFCLCELGCHLRWFPGSFSTLCAPERFRFHGEKKKWKKKLRKIFCLPGGRDHYMRPAVRAFCLKNPCWFYIKARKQILYSGQFNNLTWLVTMAYTIHGPDVTVGSWQCWDPPDPHYQSPAALCKSSRGY